MSTQTEFIEYIEHDMHIRAVVLNTNSDGSRLLVQPVAAFLSGQWMEFEPDTVITISADKVVKQELNKMDCKRCHGAGYIYITRGDDDHTCPECHGTGDEPFVIIIPDTDEFKMALEEAINEYERIMNVNKHGVTIAVEEPLSPLAEIRLQLAAMDNVFNDGNYEWKGFERTKFELELNLAKKLHLLLDTIDAQAKEIEDLQAENTYLLKEWYT